MTDRFITDSDGCLINIKTINRINPGEKTCTMFINPGNGEIQTAEVNKSKEEINNFLKSDEKVLD